MNPLDEARAALAAIPPDLPRDQWHEVGRAALAAGLDVYDLDGWSASAANYQGTKDVIASFKGVSPDGGTQAATLFFYAKQHGWTPTKAVRSQPSTRTAKTAPRAGNQAVIDVWARCVPAHESDVYIERKQGRPDGLRVYPATAEKLVIRGQDVGGFLAVPCWDEGELQTLQFIPPTKGDKLNFPGASFGGGFFQVGEIGSRVYLVEGIGQAWACHKATGQAAVVCFGAGRMRRVAGVLRAKHPDAALVIVPDAGLEAQAQEIAAEVGGLFVRMPPDSPKNFDLNDMMKSAGVEAVAELLAQAEAPPMRYRLLGGAELCNAAPMRWLIQGVLPRDGLAAWYGPSGSGKSFLVLDAAATVAGAAAEWFERRVIKAPVTYLCLEGEAGLGKRAQAWARHKGKPLPDGLKFVTQPFSLLSNDLHDLARAIKAGGGVEGLVIIDTLSRAAPGADENSSVDMGRLIAAAKELQGLVGGLVLLVHHVGKDGGKGLRGHSSLFAALDSAIEVSANDARRAWTVAKSKDDITGESHPFRLEIVNVGVDDQGEPITSCVVIPDQSTAEVIRKAAPPGGGNQRIAWDALGELLKASRHFGQGKAPAVRPCVRLADAVDAIAPSMPTEPKRQRERAQLAISGLIGRGCLNHFEGWLWLP